MRARYAKQRDEAAENKRRGKTDPDPLSAMKFLQSFIKFPAMMQPKDAQEAKVAEGAWSTDGERWEGELADQSECGSPGVCS